MEQLSWSKTPPQVLFKGVEVEGTQRDWNQTLTTTINQAYNLALGVKQSPKPLMVAAVMPQLSCSEDVREIIESLEFYDSKEECIRNFSGRKNIYVDFINPEPSTLLLTYGDNVTIKIV